MRSQQPLTEREGQPLGGEPGSRRWGDVEHDRAPDRALAAGITQYQTIARLQGQQRRHEHAGEAAHRHHRAGNMGRAGLGPAEEPVRATKQPDGCIVLTRAHVDLEPAADGELHTFEQ